MELSMKISNANGIRLEGKNVSRVCLPCKFTFSSFSNGFRAEGFKVSRRSIVRAETLENGGVSIAEEAADGSKLTLSVDSGAKIFCGLWHKTECAGKLIWHWLLSVETTEAAALILIRHGESLWNSKNLFTGCVDVPLSQKGVEEALYAGKRISEIPVDLIFTSDLIRAQMTAMLAMTQHRKKKVRKSTQIRRIRTQNRHIHWEIRKGVFSFSTFKLPRNTSTCGFIELLLIGVFSPVLLVFT